MATLLKSRHIRHHFSRVVNYGLEDFLNIYKLVYKDVVRLFYANMTVVNDTEPIIQSSVLETHIVQPLSSVSNHIELPNVSGHCYLTAFVDLPTYGRTELEVYTTITLTTHDHNPSEERF